jgi:hypothetical protein
LPPKLSYQVNVRLSPDQYEAIERRGLAERRPVAEIVRLLVEWALPQLARPGTIAALGAKSGGRIYSRRVSEELQEQMHSALDIIFERAPSAGKYSPSGMKFCGSCGLAFDAAAYAIAIVAVATTALSPAARRGRGPLRGAVRASSCSEGSGGNRWAFGAIARRAKRCRGRTASR